MKSNGPVQTNSTLCLPGSPVTAVDSRTLGVGQEAWVYQWEACLRSSVVDFFWGCLRAGFRRRAGVCLVETGWHVVAR